MLRDDPDRMAMLTGGQTKLDANKDGKISGEDFAMLREENKKKREEMQEGGMIDKPLGSGGVKSGPPPKRGPNPQGLNIPLKQVKT